MQHRSHDGPSSGGTPGEEFRWWRGNEGHGAIVGRVAKAERVGVQEKTLGRGLAAGVAIERVTNNWVPNMVKVDADLVGSPGVQVAAH